MKKLLALPFLALFLTACSEPRAQSEDGQAFSRTEQEINRRLESVGSSLEELDAFIQNNDHTFPDKMSDYYMNVTSSGYRYVLALQATGFHMSKQGAAPERFAYLCNEVQFSTTGSDSYEYSLDRMVQAICTRGDGVTTIDPPAPVADSGS